MERFREVKTELRVVDILTINEKFTCNNRRGGSKQIASRLDRFLISKHIIRLDIFYEASILPLIGSEHWPIKLEIALNDQNKKRPFHFESFWLRAPDFLDKVRGWWSDNKSGKEGHNKMHSFQLRLKGIKNKIKKWNREEFGNIQHEQGKLQSRLERIQQQIISDGRSQDLAEEEGRVITQLEERRKQEEMLWNQKSQIQWLKEGDKNSKFFHKAMLNHRQDNKLFYLKDNEGNRVTQQDEIEQLLVEHFKIILSEPNVNQSEDIDKICHHIPKKVSIDQNLALLRIITKEELEETINKMSKNKASGPNGFTIEFYQATWSFMGNDLRDLVEESRLKPIVPDLIASEQTGFAKGWQITDGIIVAQEVIHSLKSSRALGMLIKLDMAKAFDRLS
eukprot:PITA_33211